LWRDLSSWRQCSAGPATYDYEGDDRIIDGDGDGMATVDMSVDEVAVAGTGFQVHLPLVPRNH
jgi:hypothetical protein